MKDTSKKKKVLSGVQPTGELHIGHYLGVLKNFVSLQEKYDCHFMIANLHSLTAFYDNYAKSHSFIANILCDWLAAGIDPDQSVIFVQSEVSEHAELNLILSMMTPLSWLMRNPTYKDKKEQTDQDIDSYGFLGYPILQAADILLYQTDLVPIGEDQLPHLELTREVARRFNHFYGTTFKIPEARLSESPKVSGTDGRKMSKSYNNTLGLASSEETLSRKVMKMVTDPARVRRNDPGNPEVCPVYSYYSFFSPDEKEVVEKDCRSAKIGCVECKSNILQKMKKHLQPFREKRKELSSNPAMIQRILKQGNQRAKEISGETLKRVKANMKLDTNYKLI